MSLRSASLAALLALACLIPALALAASAPHVLRRIPVAGEGGWDDLSVDGATHRLFVTHSTCVEVIDLTTDSLVGRVEGISGAHAVALASPLGRGFASSGRDSSVMVFDLKTLAVIVRIAVPARNPDAIIFDPASRRVFAFGGGSANAVVIDAATDSVVGTVPLGGRPEFAVVDGKGTLFVNIEDQSAILALDTRSLAVKSRWPIAPGKEPSGLAIDRAHQRLFAVCGNETLTVVDAAAGKVVAALPIGKGVDGVAYDAVRGLVYSSNGEGTMSVFHQDGPDRYTAVATVPTERGARTCTIDPATGVVYSPTAEFGPPPAPTADRPRPRPSIVPGTFRVLVVGP